MRTFERIDERSRKPGPERLPVGHSVAVIAGLSTLLWGLLYGLVILALRSLGLH